MIHKLTFYIASLKKYGAILIALLGCYAMATAQPVASKAGNLVIVERADITTLQKTADSTNLVILEGNVKLRQGNSVFFCKRCIKNEKTKTFEAWGDVHIKDSDTTDVYADHLRYLEEKQVAFLDGNVKLTDGVATLTTPSMQYDMGRSIASYNNNGKVVNKKTIITSKEGFYYSDLKDAYFKNSVVVNDPAYHIKADSLLYNTGSQIARFISQTTIKDSANRTILTKDGFYNLRTGDAEFNQRPFINNDNQSTLTADKVALTEKLAQAEGNARIVDSTRNTIVIANLVYQDRISQAMLATQKPLMIIKQENDSIFVAADTLFSARLTDLAARRDISKPGTTDTTDSLSNSNHPQPQQAGAPQVDLMPAQPADTSKMTTPTLPVMQAQDSIKKIEPEAMLPTDSLLSVAKQKPLLPDPLKTSRDSMGALVKDTTILLAADSLVAAVANQKKNIETAKKTIDPKNKTRTTPSATPGKPQAKTAPEKTNTPTANANRTGGTDTTLLKTGNQQESLTADAVPKEKDLAENDSTNRYFEAFHNVKIYTDSMQAVSDSMFYSFKDSVFRLYKNPVVWGKENQITGDTIHLHTRNKQPSWFEAIKNSFMVTHLQKEAFNQIKSSRMDGFFTDGDLDSVRAKGSAASIYYIQDEDSAFTGINQSTSDIIDVYLKKKEVQKVVFRGQAKGTLHPIQRAKPSEMKLEGFQWLDARRPKSKYELFE